MVDVACISLPCYHLRGYKFDLTTPMTENERAQIPRKYHTNGELKQKDVVDNNGVNHLSTKYGLASCLDGAQKRKIKWEKKENKKKLNQN